MTSLPQHIKYLIIGAGIHGLSTAYHLALKLRSRKIGSGTDILVIDKDERVVINARYEGYDPGIYWIQQPLYDK